MLTRMRLVIVGLILTAVVVNTTPVLAASEAELLKGATKEGKVLWYSTLPSSITERLIKLFEQKYAVRVEFIRAGGLGMIQRIYAEQQKNIATADVIHSAAAEAFPEMKRKGWLARIDDLPEWKNILDNYKDKDGRYLTLRVDAIAVLFSETSIGQAPPKSLKDFADASWKERLVVADPSASGAALLWCRWILSKPDLGYKFLKSLGANGVLVVRGTGQVSDTVLRGARAVALMQQEHEYVRHRKERVGFYYPAEGFPVVAAPAAILANAPHPSAARLLLNFLVSPDAQDVILQEGLSSARRDIDNSKYFSWKKSLTLGWQPDWESITEQDTKDTIQRVSQALRGG